MQISVIIVNYKTKEFTKNAVESVIQQTCGLDYEIIVVDNNSQDGSAEYLRSNFGDKIKLIVSEKNIGFGGANNIAIRQAIGKYVFLLNPDTKILNDAVNIFYEYMEINMDAGACCGNLYDENMNPAFSFNLFGQTIIYHLVKEYLEILESVFRKITKTVKKIPYYQFNYSDKTCDVKFISGADMFIRASVFKQAGMFDENIFMYGEDADLSDRIIASGYKLKSVPKAKIIHFESKSVSNGDEKYGIFLNGIYKFYFKKYGRTVILIYLNFMIFDYCRMFLKNILPDNILKKWFAGLNSAEFYKNRIKINKREYETATKLRRN